MGVRLSQISHAKLIRLHKHLRGEAADLSLSSFLEHMDRHLKQGAGFCYDVNGTCIGVAGITSIVPCVGYMWMAMSDEVQYHPISFVKCCKVILNIASHDYHRIQADIRADQPTWIKLAKLLKFEEEGILRQYNSDRTDSILLSRIN